MESSPLTPEQQEALASLKLLVFREAVPGPFVTDAALTRILVAREFKVDPAFEMWSKMMEWRHSYRTDEITEQEMMPHIRTGKAFFRGKDKLGRICLIVKVRNHWPQQFTAEETVRYSIYLVECAVKIADQEGNGQICLIYDRTGITDANQDPNFIGLAKQMASIFKDFYAERLGGLYVLGISWLHWIIYHAVRPTLPRKTREKVHVVRNPNGLREYFELDQLMVEYTGTDTYRHPYPEN